MTEIRLPKLPPSTEWGFAEVARRGGDFALACVATTVTVNDGAIAAARIGMMGIGDTPRRADEAEALLVGKAVDANLLEAVSEAVRAAVTPNTDVHASSDYRRHLVGVLAQRTLTDAWRRASGAAA
jgi:carbon-monoxide dehydrogenase medium subunit